MHKASGRRQFNPTTRHADIYGAGNLKSFNKHSGGCDMAFLRYPITALNGSGQFFNYIL
jgi:hypothetical protein